jgi:hypothetical protein
MMHKWFDVGWWRYLFSGSPSILHILCRIKGHGELIWYDPLGPGPNMRCRDCGEDIDKEMKIGA